MTEKTIYLDNAATTKMSKTAINAMLPYMDSIYGNPSSLHSMGQKTNEALFNARELIAKLLGCEAREITFTLDITKNIKKLYGVPTLEHLTCVSSTKETVRKKIEEIKAAGIENVMALRGDIPAGLEDADRSGWDYKHAIDLVLS